jgi:hypothetical protein
MQISSTNSGLSTSTGLNSALVPVARRPAEDVSAADVGEKQAASTVTDARASQRVAPSTAVLSGEASRALLLARQRAGVVGDVQTDAVENAAVAQRAVAAYNTVAGQEQRFELDEMLVGIDVFA